MAHRNQIDHNLQMLLQPRNFKDYGPNGLQIEGRARGLAHGGLEHDFTGLYNLA